VLCIYCYFYLVYDTATAIQAYKLCSDSELLAQCRALVDSFVRPGAETEVTDMFNNL
jgi:biotin synthase-like enzyme